MAVRIKLRYDTYANWNSNAGTLAQGELGLVEYSDGRIDIHAGTDPTPQLWSSCPIVNEGVTTLSGLTDVNLTDLENGDILVYSGGSWITSGSTGSGEIVRAQSPTISGTLSAEDLVLSGNLTVNGTTTTINTNILTVDDINIELGSTTDPSDDTADGGGITLKGGTDKTFNWVNNSDSWTSSEHLDLVSGKEYKINGTGVLKSDALGSGLFAGTNSRETPQNADRLLIYSAGNWSSWITWENLKSGLEAAISGVDVDLTMPSGIFTVAKDIDTDGTNFDVTFDDQSVNTIFAGPGSVGSGQPTFRTLVTNDLPNKAVTFAKIQDSVSGGLSVIGRNTNSDGVFGEITAAVDGYVLRRSGTSLEFGTIATGGIGNSQVTLAKIANIDSNTILGNINESAAAPAALTASQVRTLLNVADGATANTGTVTSIATENGITGGIITGTGTIGLTGQAFALHNLSTSGLIARTSSGTVAARFIEAGTGLSITNGDAISGNPTISLNANLDNLLDVSITNVSGGNVLVYDETDGWINTDVIYGGNAASFT